MCQFYFAIGNSNDVKHALNTDTIHFYLQSIIRISHGSYYEAQQTIRSITNRYIHAKNYNAAIELLYQSSMILMEFKRYDEASDLFLYMLEVFEKDTKPVTDFKNQDLVKIIDFLNVLPNDDPNLSNLSKEVSRFTQKKTENEVGFTNLNLVLAKKLYYSESAELVANSEHFLFLSGNNNTESLDLLVDLIYQSYVKSPVESLGTLAARIVLPYLILSNVKFANMGLVKLIAKVKNSDRAYSLNFKHVDDHLSILDEDDDSSKLVNFLTLLISIVERASPENATNFRVLVNRYRPQLSSEEPLLQKVNIIGQLYFKVTVIAAQNNMLQQMMSGLLGGK
ncbi:unnamed protein product [Ambrosiozyma monospora]|uniref:Unnamed protein product n=1 Tax=Ambrosiozyma monospora TaxID=43982 RepID=A0A9W6YTF3_AMBMO|nr:unnamed protein product [Ambrosiozyma monospora]